MHILVLALILLLSTAQTSWSSEIYAFGPASSRYRAAKGYLIEELQTKLELEPKELMTCGTAKMGYYGPRTAEAVRRLQLERQLPVTGWAGETEYRALGLHFPTPVNRAMQLTSACGFEGTWFTAAEGSKSTKSDDGITWGLIGFTSKHGEVQRLLRAYRADNRRSWDKLAHESFSENRKVELEGCIAPGASNGCLADWGLQQLRNGTKDVLPDARSFFSAIGDDPSMRQLQLQRAKTQYWDGAALPLLKRAFKNEDVSTLSPQAVALAYDLRVFSNGPCCDAELTSYGRARFDGLAALDEQPWASETDRLRQIAEITLERLRRYGSVHVDGARRRWIDSILENRGTEADLHSFGLLLIDPTRR